MTSMGILQILIFSVLLIVLTRPMGAYMHRIFEGQRTLLSPVFQPIERLIYRLCGIDAEREMRWTTYTITMLVFNFCGLFMLYGILRFQHLLFWNPMKWVGLRPDLAFNTATSFTANTNWQSYVPETTVSYFTQMIGLTVQNFLSAATGISLAIAFIRGLTRRQAEEIGNYWVDMVRCILYVFIPLSVIGALILVSQGVVQNLSPYIAATTVEGVKQTIVQGPVASQEIIKELGTNGGGFFNANSSHPFENPTPLTNFIEMFGIFIISAGLTYTFGRYAKNQRQGWALFTAVMIMFLVGTSLVYSFEQAGNPILSRKGINQKASALQSGGNMEGKEVRFGIVNSSLFASVTTMASSGAVNSMHSSFTPLAGGILMLNIALGEVIFGGVGVGLLGLMVFAILAVFIAGLMVGRTPEYLGKKIESKEMKMAMLSVLILAAGTLTFTALSVSTNAGLSGPSSKGPHGFTEMLYAATSATGNNGSAFAGINANTPFYNTILGLAILIGRFLFIIPVMAIAGSMVRKKTVPESSGTFPTTGGLFVGLLIGVILIVGALTYFPAYALGPIVEHFFMQAGKLF